MKDIILNYRIYIEEEKDEDNKTVYSAHCPTLGLYESGKTIDKTLERMKDLIRFHIDSLREENMDVPVEKTSTTILTSIDVSMDANAHFSYV